MFTNSENKRLFFKKPDISSAKTFLFRAVCVLFMTLLSLSFLYVIVWMVLSSFRQWDYFSVEPLNIFDFKHYTLTNYSDVFHYVYVGEKRQTYNYVQMLGNSFIHISIGVGIGLIFEPLIGYVMAKFGFNKLNGVLMVLIIVSMTMPTIGTVYNTVKLMNTTLGLKNNWFNIAIQLAGGINFSAIIYMNYFKNIPTDYAESAYLDGANEFYTYISIYFALASPLLIATSVLRIIGIWNDYYSIFLYLPGRPTIAMGLWYIQNDFTLDDQYPQVFAALTVTSLISFTLYAAFANKIMSSLAVGGVKA